MTEMDLLLKSIDKLDENELEQLQQYIALCQRKLHPPSTKHYYSVRELLKLPIEERNRILEAAAAEADAEYRSNPDLTAFEAFGEDDLYDETP